MQWGLASLIKKPHFFKTSGIVNLFLIWPVCTIDIRWIVHICHYKTSLCCDWFLIILWKKRFMILLDIKCNLQMQMMSLPHCNNYELQIKILRMATATNMVYDFIARNYLCIKIGSLHWKYISAPNTAFGSVMFTNVWIWLYHSRGGGTGGAIAPPAFGSSIIIHSYSTANIFGWLNIC